MKIARLSISPELIIEKLGLPADTAVVSASMLNGDVLLTVQHEGLVDQPEGAVGIAVPIFDHAKCGCTTFREWGQR